MVMRDIGSFHYPEPRSYFNCFIVPIQYIYARLLTLIEFFDHVSRKRDHTVSRLQVCHRSSPIFEFLS